MDQVLEAPPRRRIPSWLTQALGYTLSVACLVWVLRGYDWSMVRPAIRSLDWKWVAVCVVLDLAVYLVHGWRWRILLAPVVKVPFWRTVQAIYIGLFANEVLPLRTGELIRCYLLAHWNNLRLALSFASAAIERIFDGFWMLAAFAATAWFISMPGYLVDLVQVMAALLVAAALLLTHVIVHKQRIRSIARESRWASTLRHLLEGLHAMGNLHTFGRTALVSLLYLVVQILSVWCLMRAYGLDLSVFAAAGVMTVLRFGTVIPSAPGNLGLFQASVKLALTLFEVEPGDATTFSFIMFVVLTLPLLLGGAAAVALTGLNLKELHHRARHAR